MDQDVENTFAEGCRSYGGGNVLRRSSETPEQRQARLQSMSARNTDRLATGQTPEQRQTRLQLEACQYARQIGLLLRHQSSGRLDCKVCQHARQNGLLLRHHEQSGVQ